MMIINNALKSGWRKVNSIMIVIVCLSRIANIK